MREILFISFGIFTMICAASVVLSKNPIYSAFSLILSFFGLSALYLLWGATFIAMIQILVYTGAIVVLFVFVVMLLNLDKRLGHSLHWLTISIVGVAAWFFSLLILRVLATGSVAVTPHAANVLDVRAISNLLFNQYLWPFEVLSLFLLVLIVAIFALTKPGYIEGGPS